MSHQDASYEYSQLMNWFMRFWYVSLMPLINVHVDNSNKVRGLEFGPSPGADPEFWKGGSYV